MAQTVNCWNKTGYASGLRLKKGARHALVIAPATN
jgi:hypothetical protein